MKTTDREEYVSLLKTEQLILQGPKTKPANTFIRAPEAYALFTKHFYHCATALYLSGRTNIPILNNPFTDYASLHVIARAAVESCLVYFYIFAEPESMEEADFRYLAWSLSGYTLRSNFSAYTKWGQEKLDQSDKERQIILNALQRNSRFASLSQKQKKRIVDRGEWRLDAWTHIARSMGLAESLSNVLYGYFCEYAHSGSLSVWQVRDESSEEIRETLSNTVFRHLLVTMAFMIHSFRMVFPSTELILNEYPELHELVQYYLLIGRNFDD